MAITFYYGSGSPPAWRVWLALEHKELSYDQKVLSFGGGDLKKPEFLAVNPRGKVPAIVDDGFALWESVAIVEYLDHKYPNKPLFPRDVKAAARVRRVIQEADHYYAPPTGRLLRNTLFKPNNDGDPKEIAEARGQVIAELERIEASLKGDEFLAGPLSAADYTFYPMLALTRRIEKKTPEHGVARSVGPKVEAWAKRIEALPYFAKTIPPHWK